MTSRETCPSMGADESSVVSDETSDVEFAAGLDFGRCAVPALIVAMVLFVALYRRPVMLLASVLEVRASSAAVLYVQARRLKRERSRQIGELAAQWKLAYEPVAPEVWNDHLKNTILLGRFDRLRTHNFVSGELGGLRVVCFDVF